MFEVGVSWSFYRAGRGSGRPQIRLTATYHPTSRDKVFTHQGGLHAHGAHCTKKALVPSSRGLRPRTPVGGPLAPLEPPSQGQHQAPTNARTP